MRARRDVERRLSRWCRCHVFSIFVFVPSQGPTHTHAEGKRHARTHLHIYNKHKHTHARTRTHASSHSSVSLRLRVADSGCACSFFSLFTLFSSLSSHLRALCQRDPLLLLPPLSCHFLHTCGACVCVCWRASNCSQENPCTAAVAVLRFPSPLKDFSRCSQRLGARVLASLAVPRSRSPRLCASCTCVWVCGRV